MDINNTDRYDLHQISHKYSEVDDNFTKEMSKISYPIITEDMIDLDNMDKGDIIDIRVDEWTMNIKGYPICFFYHETSVTEAVDTVLLESGVHRLVLIKDDGYWLLKNPQLGNAKIGEVDKNSFASNTYNNDMRNDEYKLSNEYYTYKIPKDKLDVIVKEVYIKKVFENNGEIQIFSTCVDYIIGVMVENSNKYIVVFDINLNIIFKLKINNNQNIIDVVYNDDDHFTEITALYGTDTEKYLIKIYCEINHRYIISDGSIDNKYNILIANRFIDLTNRKYVSFDVKDRYGPTKLKINDRRSGSVSLVGINNGAHSFKNLNLCMINYKNNNNKNDIIIHDNNSDIILNSILDEMNKSKIQKGNWSEIKGYYSFRNNSYNNVILLYRLKISNNLLISGIDIGEMNGHEFNKILPNIINAIRLINTGLTEFPLGCCCLYQTYPHFVYFITTQKIIKFNLYTQTSEDIYTCKNGDVITASVNNEHNIFFVIRATNGKYMINKLYLNKYLYKSRS